MRPNANHPVVDGTRLGRVVEHAHDRSRVLRLFRVRRFITYIVRARAHAEWRHQPCPQRSPPGDSVRVRREETAPAQGPLLRGCGDDAGVSHQRRRRRLRLRSFGRPTSMLAPIRGSRGRLGARRWLQPWRRRWPASRRGGGRRALPSRIRSLRAGLRRFRGRCCC